MLAGLLFAVQEAEDRAGALAATLHFAGSTLLEYQARLVHGLGAAQIIVVVGRLTPELLGAVARIGRRGVPVDVVRTAREAIDKLHPLARLLMVADSLVTTAAVAAPFAADGADALLVTDAGERTGAAERLGPGLAWAGIARVTGQRLAEVAALPRDYDFQSALLRTLAQAGAERVPLDSAQSAGHGIERSGAALEARGRSVMAVGLNARRGWFDRFVFAPLARPFLARFMERGFATLPLVGAAGTVALLGLAALWLGQPALGAAVCLLGALLGMAGGAVAAMRDEAPIVAGAGIALDVVPALAALLLGRAADAADQGDAGLVAALALVALGGADSRATTASERAAWQAGPTGYLALLATAALIGAPRLGLAAAAAYACVSTIAGVARLRRLARP